MYFTNIRKWALFNKGFEQYNKKNPWEKLTFNELLVLYAVFSSGAFLGCTMEQVYNLLKGIRHTRNRNKIRDILRTFTERELIKIVSENPTKYYISVYGRTVLGALEKSIKAQRIDKVNTSPKSQLGNKV